MPSLVFFTDRKRREVQLVERDTTIGREDDCVIQLHDDPEVSRLHCTVQRQEDGSFILLDENAKNGTFLNAERVLNEERTLKDGDEIRVGRMHLRFFEKFSSDSKEIFSEVARQMEQGKGYHTIMHEILDD